MTSSPEPASPSRGSASPPLSKDKGKSPASASEASESPEPRAEATDAPGSTTTPQIAGASASAGDWQAIWSPTHNAYYFYNASTRETTWSNPLEASQVVDAEPTSPPDKDVPDQDQSIASSTSTPALAQLYALQAAAAAQGIDPSLAYLDPSLASGSSTMANPSAYAHTAKFNSRTGAFARPEARDPGHLSEYERMKRMNEVFFDQGKWEADLAMEKAQEEGEGKKRKKPTKKDLVSRSAMEV